MANKLEGSQDWSPDIKRAGRVVLDPLTEVGIRVLMSIGIGRSQFVVDILRDPEWCDREQQ